MAHNGSRLADVIEKELKAKLIQMKKELIEIMGWIKAQKQIAIKLAESLQHTDEKQAYHFKGKFVAFCELYEQLGLLLNSESENSGKNDADNIGKPM